MPTVFAFFTGPLPWLVLAVVTVVCLWVDLHFFARGREPSFREGVVWSIGWLVFSLLVGVVVLVVSNADDAITYTTVYFIERSLSLDNLFVFLLLFSYFGIAEAYRARLLFWGIAAALVLRGLAILGGVALIEQFHFVIYVLGVLLLILAYRILQGVDENVDPDKNFVVRLVRKVFPVTPDDLIPRVQRVLEDKKEKIVYLKGDKDAKYSAIMDAMDAFRKAQIENIALITEKKNKPGGAAGGAQ